VGVTNKKLYTEQQNRIADTFKLLGHPARISILEFLIDQNQCVCNDLVNHIGLAQATISQHLRELKHFGLIQGEIEGTSVCYCINAKKWSEIHHLIHSFTNQELNNLQCK